MAAAHYAHKRGLDLVVYEGASEVGGNARTLKLGNCLFDTGAHRIHDKHPSVTRELRCLLGEDLLRVSAPSEIRLADRQLRFPLQPGDLLRKLDWSVLARVAFERMSTGGRHEPASFRDWAIARYGHTLSELLLIGYSEKLWGERADRLSPRIAGGRLRHLDLRAFLRGMFSGDDPRHADGTFLYPKFGFGTIFNRISEKVGPAKIRCNSRVTRLTHSQGRIQNIELNGRSCEIAETIISTLPLTMILEILDPKPPDELLDMARSIRFRKLLLLVFCLNRPLFSDNASIYYPEPGLPFTRLYECKNRSPHMAPDHQTALVLEVPCHETSAHWRMSDASALRSVFSLVKQVEPLKESEILNSTAIRLPFAYPILEIGIEKKVGLLMDYLSGFENLHLLGRNAQFSYLHTHDLFLGAQNLLGELN